MESRMSFLITTNSNLSNRLGMDKSAEALPGGDTNYPNDTPYISSSTDYF